MKFFGDIDEFITDASFMREVSFLRQNWSVHGNLQSSTNCQNAGK